MADHVFDHIATNRGDRIANSIGVQQLIALMVDNLPLFICNVIKLQQLFTDIKVAAFYFTLGFFNRIVHHAVFNRLTLIHAQRLHKTTHAIRCKNTHQIIFQ